MLPINPIRDPRKHDRGVRAARSLALLPRILDADLPDPAMRWDMWKDLHHAMAEALDAESLQNFQANEKIAPQICGGGGEAYLRRIRERFGESALAFFMSTFRETLCGNPQDVTCSDGCYITRTSMRHVYHLAALHRFVKNQYCPPIDTIEVGGGFGNLARLLVQYSLSRRHFIVDYAASLCVQHYYLTEFFPAESVAVWNGSEYLSGSADSVIRLATPDAVPALAAQLRAPTLLVSTMALTEIPAAGQQYYLDNIPASAVYVFGQTRSNAQPRGRHVGDYGEISNEDLFRRLAATCHVVDFVRGDYYSELLGLI